MNMLMRAALAVLVTLAGGLAGASEAKAEPGPLGIWLMNQPVTLWDRGMDAMEDSARAAADRIKRARGLKRSVGFVHGYLWDENEINVNFSFDYGYKNQTLSSHKTCNAIRSEFINRFVSPDFRTVNERPKFPRETQDQYEKRRLEQIYQKIESWFSHRGFQEGGRDKELGKKMARIIFVTAISIAHNVECRNRITVREAPSIPLFGDMLSDPLDPGNTETAQ